MGRALGLIIPPKKEAKIHQCNGAGSKAANRENTLENGSGARSENGSGARSNEGGYDGFEPAELTVEEGIRVSVKTKQALPTPTSQQTDQSSDAEEIASAGPNDKTAAATPASRLKPIRRRVPDHLRFVRSHPCSQFSL
jgi:hypothetical protein